LLEGKNEQELQHEEVTLMRRVAAIQKKAEDQ
jgi:hypothetical protein